MLLVHFYVELLSNALAVHFSSKYVSRFNLDFELPKS